MQCPRQGPSGSSGSEVWPGCFPAILPGARAVCLGRSPAPPCSDRDVPGSWTWTWTWTQNHRANSINSNHMKAAVAEDVQHVLDALLEAMRKLVSQSPTLQQPASPLMVPFTSAGLRVEWPGRIKKLNRRQLPCCVPCAPWRASPARRRNPGRGNPALPNLGRVLRAPTFHSVPLSALHTQPRPASSRSRSLQRHTVGAGGSRGPSSHRRHLTQRDSRRRR